MIDIVRWLIMGLSLSGGLLTPKISPKYRFYGFVAWFISNFYWMADGYLRGDYQMMCMYIFFEYCNLDGMINNYRETKKAKQ